MTTVLDIPVSMAKTYVGDFRRFGELGPAYEVIIIEDKATAVVRVLESGETLRYPLDSIQNDPAA